MKAIIGGTGVYGTSHNSRVEKVETKFGQVELDIVSIDGEGGEIAIHDIQGSVDKNRENITDVFIKIFKEGLIQENCNCNSSIIQL